MTETELSGLIWMLCDCNVWPIHLENRIGRCLRCNKQPSWPCFVTKPEAVDTFRKLHGKEPWCKELEIV